MTYDTMKAAVTITVTKSGHALTATKLLPTDTEFNNTFTPSATTAQFSFTKRLEGKTLEANAFTFELLENGNVIQTKERMPKMEQSPLTQSLMLKKVRIHTLSVK